MNNELYQSEWFKSRPKIVQKAIIDYPPGYFYILKSTGQKVRLYSYTENKKGCTECTILILKEDNPDREDVERKVFGVPLDDLERKELINS